jgi:hypothetical protein
VRLAAAIVVFVEAAAGAAVSVDKLGNSVVDYVLEAEAGWCSGADLVSTEGGRLDIR